MGRTKSPRAADVPPGLAKASANYDAGPREGDQRDMPEHLRWLHERWRSYDSTFFGDKRQRCVLHLLSAPQMTPLAVRHRDEQAEERREYDPRKGDEHRGRRAEREEPETSTRGEYHTASNHRAMRRVG